MLSYKVPPKIYFKRGATNLALRELSGKKRAFIVTDRFLFNSGAVNTVIDILDEINISYQIFFDIKPNPSLSTINQAMEIIKPFEPDVFIALGGGSTLDAAKIMWLEYEQPNIVIQNLSGKAVDSICTVHGIEKKAQMVCIPTTSGTGSEVTPFANITDDKTQTRFAVTGYNLTPDMAIIDPNFVDTMPKGLTSSSGMNALVQAIEAYVSNMATNFTNSNALEAIKLIFRYLERAYNDGAKDPLAKEKMHYASTISGMAFANSDFGLCNLLVHELVSKLNIPHGVANALLINQVIKFNLSHSRSNIKKDYAQIADELNLGGNSEDEKVELLINEIIKLKDTVNLPKSIKTFGIPEQVFYEELEKIVNFDFNNRCEDLDLTSLTKDDVKQIYINAYEGII